MNKIPGIGENVMRKAFALCDITPRAEEISANPEWRASAEQRAAFLALIAAAVEFRNAIDAAGKSN